MVLRPAGPCSVLKPFSRDALARLVLFMALFIDRPLIAAKASAPVFVETFRRFRPFGNSIFPIVCGCGAMVLCLVWD